MLRTVTQKCPCGYIFKETSRIEKKKVEERNCSLGFGSINCDTVEQKNQKKTCLKETVVEQKIINGDEKFKNFPIITTYDPISDFGHTTNFLICPKCGAVLMPQIAMNVEEKEE